MPKLLREWFVVRQVGALTIAIVVTMVAISGCGRSTKDAAEPEAKVEKKNGALVRLSRFGWTASPSVTATTSSAANALDDNATTGWNSGTSQVADQYFQ